MKSSSVEEFFTLGNVAPTPRELLQLGRHWGWILATGIIYVVLGALAFYMPLASTLGLTLSLGLILLAGGLIHLVHAYQLRHEQGSAARFFQSVIAILTGAVVLRYPEAGMLGMAIALSFYFFVSAAAQWILYSSTTPEKRWGWALASSLVSFLLGVFIILNFPFSALWVPGTLLGIDLIFAGSSMIGLAVYCRSLVNNVHEPKLSRA